MIRTTFRGEERSLFPALAMVAELMIRILKTLGSESIVCVHAEDGMDELSISGQTRIFRFQGADQPIREEIISPEQLGLIRADHDAIKGGDATENADILRRVFDGEAGAKRDIVLLNAAFGLLVAGVVDSAGEGLERAAESIDSGKARAALDRLVEVSGDAPVRTAG